MEDALQSAEDPPIIDWRDSELPDAWPDALSMRRPADLRRLLRCVVRSSRERVVLPAGLPGADRIPSYLLQQFHNLPNGNYSKHVTRGYSKGFDLAMLGVMKERRRALAAALGKRETVLDLGCGAGHTAGALAEAGVAEVWGLDPSPYLLQLAAERYPEVRFVQGVAERTGFPSARFDGVSACFLFHELPPRYGDQALAECHRILKPGGALVVIEPSAEQWRESTLTLLWRHGWRGGYFRGMSRFVFEPFLEAFHRRDLPRWFAQHGFELAARDSHFPTVQWTAVRR